ncbi:MAG: hypothetical protein QOF08_1936 [Gaiellales bacterium]|nr:hypothetical protein [Gaiellales bacterium]
MNIARARNPLRLLIAMVAMLAIAALAGSATSARADSAGPITFESPAYTAGPINGQNGWTDTGFDANVVALSGYPDASGYGFGGQALQISDAVTSGAFGNQTFAPALAQPAGEATPQRYFTASFKIGTTQASQQCALCVDSDTAPNPLHLSVSPDNGSGGRMSYLRFEDLADGVHVFFSDVTDSGPYYTQATFNESDIATLSRTTSHTIDFSIHFIPGPGNDVVTISIDGVVKATGTTWEDYYRYDNETQGGTNPPTTSTLEFREGGAPNSADQGQGFLIDNVSTDSNATAACLPTGFMRDGINLTAAQIGGTVTGSLNAAGSNIGVYNPTSVSGANISGANYYGVVDNGITTSISNSSIHNIGEVPFNGTQHGNAVLYINGAHGTISGSTVSSYQKNGITVSGKAANGVDAGPTGSSFKTSVSVLNNTVTGEGKINYIAQNGIQISYGATAIVRGDSVSNNWYTPPGVTACGLLLFQAGGVTKSGNSLFANETNFCNAGRGGGQFKP